MANLETPADLAEHLATVYGFFGACNEDAEGKPGHAEGSRACRVCFVLSMSDRIRDAVRNERVIEAGSRAMAAETSGRDGGGNGE